MRIPQPHTALLNPYGYDVEAKHGRISQNPQVPPAKATNQVKWVEKQSDIELDNASLVAEYETLKKAKAGGKIDFGGSPAYHYDGRINKELYDRIKAILSLIEYVKEAEQLYKDRDKDPDGIPNFEINATHFILLRTLDSGPYKRLVRSSIEPLFTLPDFWGNYYDDVKKYFEAHGGIKTAHSVKWTIWDPSPNKTQLKTSTAGQNATVVQSSSTGAVVDIDGVRYILYTKTRYAIVKESFKTAVQGKDIVIPEAVEYNGVMYPVVKIAASAFENNGIRSVIIPSSVKEIAIKAFRGCNMTEVIIPASVKVVDGTAFQQCQNLTKVVFQAQSMDKISDNCFCMCTKLKSVTFPASLTKDFGREIFSGCTSLTEVVLPQNMRTIPAKMFYNCKSLTTLKLPTTITKVEVGAISGSGLTSLYLPNLQEVGANALSGCMSLKSVTISKSMAEKFKAENYSLYADCFGFDNPNLSLKVNAGKLSMPSSIKVQ